MKHLLLISHGSFALGMLESVSMIAGKQEGVEALCIRTDTSTDSFKQEIHKKCLAYGDEPIIIVSDIAGGSTTQCALSLMDQIDNLYIVCGLNLALVLELVFLPFSKDRKENNERLKDVILSNQRCIMLVEQDKQNHIDADSDDL